MDGEWEHGTTAIMNGHTIEYDSNKDVWFWQDTGEQFNFGDTRPCKHCGINPTEEGHDYCIRNLSGVINACCGHGEHEGHIMFENNIIIRGYFSVERFPRQ